MEAGLATEAARKPEARTLRAGGQIRAGEEKGRPPHGGFPFLFDRVVI